MQGTVKNFGKSYGFICGENDKEYFVHYSNLKAGYKRLHSGDYVEFTPEENDKGLIAVNVVPVLTLKSTKREFIFEATKRYVWNNSLVGCRSKRCYSSRRTRRNES